MSTNFYIQINYCLFCERGDLIHLGLSSWGWKFSCQYNNGQYYKSWEEMKAWLKEKVQTSGTIQDEYGRSVSLKEFIELVETKQKEPQDRFRWLKHERESSPSFLDLDYEDSKVFQDSEGYIFCNYEFS